MVEERDELITDGRTPSPQERWSRLHRRDLDGSIPNLLRRDRVKLDAVLAVQNPVAAEQPDMETWHELEAGNARRTRGADFSKPTFDRSPNSGPRTNALGQSVRRARRWSL